MIAETRYIAKTQQTTVADLFAFHEISLGYNHQSFLESYPVVKVWFEEIANNPVFIEFETIKNLNYKRITG
jgi:glutathione S-transferase